jgi:hypothetical protein
MHSLDDAERGRIEQMLEDGLDLLTISKNVDVSYYMLRKLYRGHRGKRGRNPSTVTLTDEERQELEENVRKYATRIRPLYDPNRDGPVVYPSLTARLLGDPPLGRREILDQWAEQNSKRRSTDFNEEL